MNDNDIKKLITDEKYNLELKEQVNFDEPKKYLKSVSSFANSYDIGYIIFGVEDGSKKIVGVQDLKKSYEEISSGKLARRTIQEYDLDAMREAIINAEAHRSYLMRGTNVELAFYDDRIEIVSCGTIGNNKTLKELLKRPTSQRKNQLVCDIFSRLNFMERRGSGIKKIFLAYEHDEKKPEFEIIGDVFIVTFYSRLHKNVERNVEKSFKEKYPELSNISIDILNLLEQNKYLKQGEVAKKLNKAPNTIYRNIKILKDIGIIERVGSTKKGYWRINF